MGERNIKTHEYVPSGAIENLLESLAGEPVPSKRNLIIMSLARFPVDEAIPALYYQFTVDGDWTVRQKIIELCRGMKHTKVLEMIILGLIDEDLEVRKTARDALVKFREEEIEKVLQPFLKIASRNEKARLIEAFSSCGDMSPLFARKLLENFFEDPMPDIRSVAREKSRQLKWSGIANSVSSNRLNILIGLLVSVIILAIILFMTGHLI